MSTLACAIAGPLSVSVFNTSPVSRIFADGSDTVLPCAHDVDVAIDAFAGLGVVVIQAERVRLRALEEVDDLAILERALGHADALHRRQRGARIGGVPAPVGVDAAGGAAADFGSERASARMTSGACAG